MTTLGLDLGGTKIAAAVVDEHGTMLRSERVPTPRSGFRDVADAMATLAERLLANDASVTSIGIGSPGPLDLNAGTVLFAPNIPGMENAPLAPTLQERLGLPVVLENDANAAGYAEHRFGAARGLESSVYVTLSTGIGGGLFLGDRVVHGAHGVAGEIGHVTLLPGGPVGGDGSDGTLEALAAGRSIARDGSYVFGRTMTTEKVFEAAIGGDAKALRIVDGATRITGIALANLVKILDPDAFVIGGGMSQVGAFYLDRIEAAARHYLRGWPEPVLLPARLGTDAGVIGAAAVAAKAGR
ncbi:MAG: ROK family protein [Trueperaceae bacterium]